MLSNKYSWWGFKGALSNKFCDELIEYANQQETQDARVGIFSEHKKNLSEGDRKEIRKYRNSNITWLSEPWISNQVLPFVKEANKKAGWNYDWDYAERMQFTRYFENQYYHWHVDEFTQSYEQNHRYKGKVRKLSVTCILNDGNEYEGGDLEFQYRDKTFIEQEKCNLSKIKGSVIVFPSYVFHRVTPVLKGRRYSLVVWTLGEPWK